MKRKFTILFFALILGAGSVWGDDKSISEATDGYYHITDQSTWSAFARTVNGTGDYANHKNSAIKAMLDKDVTISSPGDFEAGFVVGTSSNPYTGTFDGNGHTLSFTKSDGISTQALAPFGYINGATIQNLKVEGSLTSTHLQAYMGGVVAVIKSSGSSTVQYCSSAMVLNATNDTENETTGKFDGNMGGIVGRIESGATATVQGCMFTGTINSIKSTSGIVGYNKGTLTVKNNLAKCTFTLTNTSAASNRYIYREESGTTVTQSDNYYQITLTTNVPVSGNGTAAQTAQYNSGEMAWYLSGADNSSSSTYFWGQGNLNKSTAETFPVLTNDATKKVYRIMVNSVSNYPYGNRSGAVPNPVRYGYTAFSTESTVENRTTPLTEISSSYNTAGLYGISNIYTLKIGDALASTLVLPFEAVIPDNITAYTLTNTSGEAATATKITTGTIPANTPVLINATAANNYDFKKKTDSTWAPDATAIDWSGATVTSGALTGVYVQNDKSGLYNPTYYVPANSYVLQNGSSGLGFYKVAADNTIKITSFRAYLTASASAREFLGINFDEGASNIDQIEVAPVDDDVIYDLSGRMIEHPTKGIYVKNGKKFIVK